MKSFFVEKLITEIGLHSQSKVVDMGSGLSKNFYPLLERFPELNYIGIEPDPSAASQAKTVLKKFPNANVYTQTGYSLPASVGDGWADLVISLSTLEHVKQLDELLAASVKAAKPGAWIIHRYDLGHALYPSSWKERFQLFLCKYFSFIIPENKYVAYVSPSKVIAILEKYGAQAVKTTYHQMPNHKEFLRYFKADSSEKTSLANTLMDWEFQVSSHLEDLPQDKKEKLFPSICVWVRKNKD